MLLCPVRGCHLELARAERRLMCARGHSFDIARSGYVNLLQPQERRSKNPGDSEQAVRARRRLHDLGVTRPLLAGIAGFTGASSRDIVLDAGCGDGFYLGSLAQAAGFEGHGIDISTPAIDAAARRFPECHWIVGNADRFIPYANESFSIVLSITARMNAKEFRRVLRPDGYLVAALPAADDLIELRGAGRDRTAHAIATFAPAFALAGQRRVSATTDLDAASVEDLLLSIYRPLGSRVRGPMRITFSLDLLLFRPVR